MNLLLLLQRKEEKSFIFSFSCASRTPIQRAAHGCADSVALLAFHGANLEEEQTESFFDQSMIFSAVQSGHVDSLETLAALGITDVERGHRDWTPLMQAVYDVNIDMVRCLLKLNADTRKSFRYQTYGMQSDRDQIKAMINE